MKIAKILQQLKHDLHQLEHATNGPSGDGEHAAAVCLAGTVRQLLAADLDPHPEQYRVRMTRHGSGAPLADRHMRAIPSPGDFVNAASGSLQVAEVHWNYDPRIPADVVLVMVSPGDHLKLIAEGISEALFDLNPNGGQQ